MYIEEDPRWIRWLRVTGPGEVRFHAHLTEGIAVSEFPTTLNRWFRERRYVLQTVPKPAAIPLILNYYLFFIFLSLFISFGTFNAPSALPHPFLGKLE